MTGTVQNLLGTKQDLRVLNVDNLQNSLHNSRVKLRDEYNESNYAMIRQNHTTVNN